MASYNIELISQPTHRINVPGFEHLVFSAGSPEPLSLPAAVAFNADFGGALQSARQAIAFRAAARDNDGADRYQLTRTAAINFRRQGRFYVAFDDGIYKDENDTIEDNILLSYPQVGYDSHRATGKWLVGRDCVRTAIERAENAGRVISAQRNTLVLPLNGAYARDKNVQAVIGKDGAALNEEYLRNKGLTDGYLWTISPDICKDLGVTKDLAEIRRVGLGDDDFDDDILNADDCCNNGGRVRRVRENFQGK